MNLDDFLDNPDYADLLKDLKEPKALPTTEIDRLKEIYDIVKAFYEEFDRLPEKSSDTNERQIYSKYNGLINNPDAIECLKEYDTLSILKPTTFESLDDALNDPELAKLAESGPLDLFTLKHVKKYEAPEYVARRKKCENFNDYEHLFNRCHADLQSGRREMCKFEESQIDKGKFYVIKGMLCYVANVDLLSRDKGGHLDGRLLVIFENGTESDLLMQSLKKSISTEKGLMVTVPDDEALDPTIVEDILNGTVYVLKTLIKHEEINELEHFYKIGFTTETVAERISNAENESTYMYAPVEIIAEYEILNAKAQGVEKLLHMFFAGANLEIEINGHHPREWFIVPLTVIDQAINLVISGQIIYYNYNNQNQEIELISKVI